MLRPLPKNLLLEAKAGYGVGRVSGLGFRASGLGGLRVASEKAQMEKRGLRAQGFGGLRSGICSRV